MPLRSACAVEERSESFFFLSFFVPVQRVDAELRPRFLATALRKRSRLNTDSGQMEEIELPGGICLIIILWKNKVSVLYNDRQEEDWKSCNSIPFYLLMCKCVYICTA